MASGAHRDIPARVIGMLVFLAGVAALGYVFYIAYGLFQAPASQTLGLTFKNDPKTDPTAAAIGSQFGVLLFRLAYLFLMSIAGSLIANKGINLYFAALHGSPAPPVTKTPSPPAN